MKEKSPHTQTALIALRAILYFLAYKATGSSIDYLTSLHLVLDDTPHSVCFINFYSLPFLVPFLISTYGQNGSLSIWADNYCKSISNVSIICSATVYVLLGGYAKTFLIDCLIFLVDYLIRSLENNFKQNC